MQKFAISVKMSLHFLVAFSTALTKFGTFQAFPFATATFHAVISAVALHELFAGLRRFS